MCEVGRIKHHLKHNIWNPKNTILFVGYQAQGTLGRKIVDGAKAVKIFGEEVAVNARVEYIEGYSGHADQEGLLNFVSSFTKRPNHIFLVHGEEDGQKVLRDKIVDSMGIEVTIPDYGESYELTDHVRFSGNNKARGIKEFRKLEIIDRMETLKEEIVDMESFVKEDILADSINDEEISRLNERIKALERQIVEIVENK